LGEYYEQAQEALDNVKSSYFKDDENSNQQSQQQTQTPPTIHKTKIIHTAIEDEELKLEHNHHHRSGGAGEGRGGAGVIGDG